jgi:pyrroloquinoline quinone biosynthesis protein B
VRAIILGSGAGGGFPQWNCGCANCTAVRQRRPGFLPRTQDSVALIGDRGLVLVNCSPDVLVQIQRTTALWPRAGVSRGTPIAGIVLTNGDLDHVLGLFSLRESQPLAVYATAAVWAGLEQSVFLRTLRRFDGQLAAHVLGLDEPVTIAGLELTAMPLAGKRPVHLPGEPDAGDNVGLRVRDRGKTLVYAAACARVRPFEADVLLFDGTFFREDELVRAGLGSARAADMAHVPIEQSLAAVHAPRRIYTHINNSNPILDPESEEHRAVIRAGWEIAFDGMEVEP